MTFGKHARALNVQQSGTRKKMPPRELSISMTSRPNLLTYLISTANACYKDAADLHAELEEYPQAIARYEQVANGSLSSPLTKYSVKEYWLRSSLCALAIPVRVVWRVGP